MDAWNEDALEWLRTAANHKPNQTTGVAPDERFKKEQDKLQPITGIKS
ncbi:hypothetical protein [Lentibacillus salinarum]|uniref:Uncharacterized protein n=1 Tax=Lentibacillus salinarum TaxID=446820 RepID=A0ABW3ZRF0_9BACI